jgi:N-acetylmuramoyl-L-alanine amidase
MLGRIAQWFRERFSPQSVVGPQPTSRNFSSPSRSYLMSAPTITSKPAPVEIKDAGLRFSQPLKPIDPQKVRYVVVHHTANANPAWGIKECHAWHKDGMGWAGCGYNYLVEQSGAAYFGRANELADYVGSHVAGYNSSSVGVCLAGNYDQQTPTPANLLTVAKIVAKLLKRYGLSTKAIRYHSELAEKSCPGSKFPPREEFARLVESLL